MFICDIRDEGDYCFDCPRSHPDEQCEYWVEVEYVKRGHWEFKDDFGNKDYDFVAVCSRCGNKKKAIGYSHSEWRLEWRYCNACGAKMFGGSDEE